MKVYVLLIGVNRYSDDIGKLKCAEKDARKLEALFEQCQFETRYLDQEDLDSGKIEAAIEQAGRILAQHGGGVFVFYFSGHGKQQDDDQIMLLPGARRDLLERGLTKTSGVFSYDTLRAVSNDWKNVQRLFIFDACRALLPTKSGDVQPAYEGIGIQRDMQPGNRVNWEREHNFTELNSCGVNQASLELPEDRGGPGHGVFSMALMGTLRASLENKTAFRVDQELLTDLQIRMKAIAQQYGERLVGQPTLYGQPIHLLRHTQIDPPPAAPVPPESSTLSEPLVSVNLDERLWRIACSKDSISAYEEYIKQSDLCAHLDKACQRIKELTLQQNVGATSSSITQSEVKLVMPTPNAVPTRQVGTVFRDFADGPELVLLPQGEFMMGSTSDYAAQPIHLVQIRYDLAVGKYPVTFAQWDACVADGGTKYSPEDYGWGRGQRPVINVSWDDVQAYVAWLNRRIGIAPDDPLRYRLLSEAEWEYACRAGSLGAWSFGDDVSKLSDYACMFDKSELRTQEVGRKLPNQFGLFDMHGNVWEWVEDCWHSNYKNAPVDGGVWPGGDCRHAARGGSWNSSWGSSRAAVRSDFDSGLRGDYLGFRVARTAR